jgi:cytoskeleton protein RodZ
MSEAGMKLVPQQDDPSDQPAGEQQEAAPAPVLSVAPSAGGMLAAAREQKKLTVQQVAEQLKLSPRQVQALEANQFDVLPKPVIVRGFVRSYAKLLKIDAEPVLALLPPDTAPPSEQVSGLRPAMAAPFMESRLPMLGRQDNNNRRLLLGGLGLAVLALLFLLFQKLEHGSYLKNLMGSVMPQASAPSQAEATTASEPAALPAQAGDAAASNADTDAGVAVTAAKQEQPALPVASSQSQATASDTIAPASTAKAASAQAKAPAMQDAQLTAKRAPEQPIAAPASQVATAQAASAATKPFVPTVPTVPASQAAASPASTAAPINPAHAFKLVFKQDSWLQVRRANGTVVTSHLARAGTQEVFDASEALQVKLGNAAGVEGSLRGAPFPIQAPAGSNVANLNVK